MIALILPRCVAGIELGKPSTAPAIGPSSEAFRPLTKLRSIGSVSNT